MVSRSAAASAADDSRAEEVDRRLSDHERECAQRYGEVQTSIEGLRADIRGMRADIGRVHQVLLQPPAAPAAGSSLDKPATHDGGFTFKHGWRSWLVVAGLGVGALAALKGALMALDWVGGGLLAAWQYLTHH